MMPTPPTEQEIQDLEERKRVARKKLIDDVRDEFWRSGKRDKDRIRFIVIDGSKHQ